MREEPVVFLHVDEDFIPYTPRRRENLHANLHDLDKGLSALQMELSIQKEVSYREDEPSFINVESHLGDHPSSF